MDFVRRNMDVKRNVSSSRNVERRRNDTRKPNNSHITSTTKTANERKIAGNREKIPATETTRQLPKPGVPNPGKPKVIPVRHTHTSKLRMEKANPLLTSTLASTNESHLLKEVNTPMRRVTIHSDMQIKPKLDFKNICPSSENRPSQKQNNTARDKKTACRLFKENKPPFVTSQQTSQVSKVRSTKVLSKLSQSISENKNSLSSSQKTTTSVRNKSLLVPNRNVAAHSRYKSNLTASCMENNFKPLTNISAPSNSNKIVKNKITEPRNVPSRQNCGNLAFHANASVGLAQKKQLKSILRKSASAGDLRKTTSKDHLESGTPSRASKLLNKSQKSVAFFSPLHNTTFSPVNIVNTPPPSVLRKRLEDWLAKRGKSTYSYHHLCCFGLPKSNTVRPLGVSQSGNNSCLNETISLESIDSNAIVSPTLDKDRGLDIENSLPKGSSTPEKIIEDCKENKENAAYIAHPEALVDLKKLVHSGYPRDQCEQWLGYISKSHPTVKELPEYWECLAALEEARGDFSAAVDCYGRAVVKGADAHDIDECLDDLWEKFSSLSVSAVETRRTPLKKLAVDSKQIFKSTVIKFALQQKAIKRTNREAGESIPVINYIVTPVRRSSRRSQSLFRSTPTIKCFDTLEDLEPNIKEKMEFHGNLVLNPGN